MDNKRKSLMKCSRSRKSRCCGALRRIVREGVVGLRSVGTDAYLIADRPIRSQSVDLGADFRFELRVSGRKSHLDEFAGRGVDAAVFLLAGCGCYSGESCKQCDFRETFHRAAVLEFVFASRSDTSCTAAAAPIVIDVGWGGRCCKPFFSLDVDRLNYGRKIGRISPPLLVDRL